MEENLLPEKDQLVSRNEMKLLFNTYESIYARWRDKRGSSMAPKQLSEQFQFIYGCRHVFEKEAPESHLEFLSTFGALRVNFWIINDREKVMVVSTEVYTLGPEMKTRGKGREAMKFIDDFFQSLATATGFNIFRLDTPNFASAKLIDSKGGYQDINDEKLNKLIEYADLYTILRLMALFDSLHTNSKIKSYEAKDGKPVEVVGAQAMDLIKRLTFTG